MSWRDPFHYPPLHHFSSFHVSAIMSGTDCLSLIRFFCREHWNHLLRLVLNSLLRASEAHVSAPRTEQGVGNAEILSPALTVVFPLWSYAYRFIFLPSFPCLRNEHNNKYLPASQGCCESNEFSALSSALKMKSAIQIPRVLNVVIPSKKISQLCPSFPSHSPTRACYTLIRPRIK